MPAPKIVILGAGPAGLTLARLLQKNNIHCTVYEGEKDRHARSQGGSLDLHPRAGQAALKAAGLFEQFRNHARPEGQALKLVRYTGEVLIDENVTGSLRPAEEDDKPEIDRTKLRNILLDSLDPRTIQWGHRVAKVEADTGGKGKHIITFEDGSQERDIDLLVGADGAWSKARPLLTDVKPYYSGITGVEVSVKSKSNPTLSDYVGAGSCFMFDEGRAIQSQRNGEGGIRSYAWVRKPESWMSDCGTDWSNTDNVRQMMVKEYFNDCSDDLKRIVLESRDSCTPRQLFMLPVGLKWESKAGITLIGDAAHVMTPFAGVGVNLAMADAMQLAKEIVARRDSIVAKAYSDSYNIELAIRAYEKEMFVRSEEFAKKTYHGLQNHFSSTGGDEFVARLQAHLAQQGKK